MNIVMEYLIENYPTVLVVSAIIVIAYENRNVRIEKAGQIVGMSFMPLAQFFVMNRMSNRNVPTVVSIEMLVYYSYILWSEEEDTEKKRRYVRNIISDIRVTLKAYGAEEVVINNNKSSYCINKEGLNCELFDVLDGKRTVSKGEAGLYLEQYPWAIW